VDFLVRYDQRKECLPFEFVFFSRSVRETVHSHEWQADQKEENVHQKVHSESLLQRIVHLRSTIRANSGSLMCRDEVPRARVFPLENSTESDRSRLRSHWNVGTNWKSCARL
jgi:hypothetical protein